MPVFPSVEWFESVRQTANDDSGFKALGVCDANMGVKVEDRSFKVSFRAFQCESVEEIDDDGLLSVDFFLEMDHPQWRSLIENIRKHDGADAEHTMNTLDLGRPRGILRSREPQGATSFLRCHLTVQKYFDNSAGIETTF